MAKDNKITLYDLALREGQTISPFVWATKYAIAHKGFEIDLVPGGFTGIMERTGDLFAVAQQAAAVEPVIAEARHHGRLGARSDYLVVLERAAADKLIKKADVERLADSFGLIAGMDTYLLGRDLYGWSLDAYETWLRTTLTALVR